MEPHRTERRPCRRVGGIELDGLLDLLQRAARAVEASERVAEEDVRVHMRRTRLERALRQGPGLAVLARDEEQCASANMRIGMRRIEVGCAPERLIRLCRIVAPQIGKAKLVVRLDQIRDRFESVAVFDRRFLEFSLRRVRVGRRQVIASGRTRVALAAGARGEQGEDDNNRVHPPRASRSLGPARSVGTQTAVTHGKYPDRRGRSADANDTSWYGHRQCWSLPAGSVAPARRSTVRSALRPASAMPCWRTRRR